MTARVYHLGFSRKSIAFSERESNAGLDLANIYFLGGDINILWGMVESSAGRVKL
jgi:hypothetical protein